jgi:hypothetical protein
MDESELFRRLRMYAGTELSVAGPNPRGASVLLPGCHVPNDDGRLSGTQLRFRTRQSNARVGESQPGPVAGAVLPRLLPESEEINLGKPDSRDAFRGKAFDVGFFT